jgi:phage recombination protein Bet
LDQVATGYEALAPEVRERWAVEQIQTIRNTVAKDLSLSEFQMGMALAGRAGLEPLAGEIWFAKSKSRDGSPGRVLIMTGRDGYLTVARRQPGYKGMDCDVVREKDDFRVERKPNGERAVYHSYSGSDVARGPVQGAWAIVYFEGKVPFYFYASLKEYKPTSDSALRHSPWSSQESVMVLKCAQSYALRIASGISGIVSEEESARAFETPAGPSDPDSLTSIAEDIPEALRDRFFAAYGDARDLRNGQVTAAAVQMSVLGQTPEHVEAYIASIEAANERARERARPDAEMQEPPDAEVVDADAPIDTEGLADPSAEKESADTMTLRRRLSDLLDRRAEVEGEEGQEAVLAEIDAEAAFVEEELVKAGGSVPGQEAMDLG